MTQGMWHRMFGLLAAIPHNQDFKSYESLPPMLWPQMRREALKAPEASR